MWSVWLSQERPWWPLSQAGLLLLQDQFLGIWKQNCCPHNNDNIHLTWRIVVPRCRQCWGRCWGWTSAAYCHCRQCPPPSPPPILAVRKRLDRLIADIAFCEPSLGKFAGFSVVVGISVVVVSISVVVVGISVVVWSVLIVVPSLLELVWVTMRLVWRLRLSTIDFVIQLNLKYLLKQKRLKTEKKPWLQILVFLRREIYVLMVRALSDLTCAKSHNGKISLVVTEDEAAGCWNNLWIFYNQKCILQYVLTLRFSFQVFLIFKQFFFIFMDFLPSLPWVSRCSKSGFEWPLSSPQFSHIWSLPSL